MYICRYVHLSTYTYAYSMHMNWKVVAKFACSLSGVGTQSAWGKKFRNYTYTKRSCFTLHVICLVNCELIYSTERERGSIGSTTFHSSVMERDEWESEQTLPRDKAHSLPVTVTKQARTHWRTEYTLTTFISLAHFLQLTFLFNITLFLSF